MGLVIPATADPAGFPILNPAIPGFNPDWRLDVEEPGRFEVDNPDENPADAATVAPEAALVGGSGSPACGGGPATLVRAAGLRVHRFPLAGYETTMSWSSSMPTTWPGTKN